MNVHSGHSGHSGKSLCVPSESLTQDTALTLKGVCECVTGVAHGVTQDTFKEKNMETIVCPAYQRAYAKWKRILLPVTADKAKALRLAHTYACQFALDVQEHGERPDVDRQR